MIRKAGSFLVLMAVVAGCSSAAITPTPPATPSPAAQTEVAPETSPSPDVTSSAAPTQAATEAPTAEATPKPTPKPSPTPAPAASATPTPAPTPTPAATPTPTPVPTPTSRADACSGTADHKSFFAEAAAVLTFDVYCAVLPSGWWLKAASYTVPNGGYLEVTYGSATQTFVVREGRDCPPDKACIAYGGPVGAASFGPLSGQLYLNSTTYSLVVTSPKPYVMYASGMTQAKFTSLAAAFVKVPKS